MAETIRPAVAVVGASPAGLGAARAAAQADADTVLLEAQDEIGVPEPPAKVAFEHLWHAAAGPPKHAIQQRTTEVTVHSPGGHRVTVEAPAWVLDRTMLDQHLASQAAKAGASVRTGLGSLEARAPTHLIAPEAELAIRPQVTVFADGAGSLASGFLPLTERPEALAWGAWDALTPEPPSPEHRIHLTLGQHAPGGRTQLTPLADGAWAHWTFVQGDRSDVEALAPDALRHTIEQVGWPRTSADEARRVAVGPDPVFRVPHRLAGDRFVVVGGAAGQGGLEIGLASGALAGRHAARAVLGDRVDPRALARYAEIWRDRYHAGYAGLARWNRWLARIDDGTLDRLLAPWDGCRLPVDTLTALGSRGVRGPAEGLLSLAREHPVPVAATAAAALPAIGRELGSALLSSDPPGRRPRPR